MSTAHDTIRGIPVFRLHSCGGKLAVCYMVGDPRVAAWLKPQKPQHCCCVSSVDDMPLFPPCDGPDVKTLHACVLPYLRFRSYLSLSVVLAYRRRLVLLVVRIALSQYFPSEALLARGWPLWLCAVGAAQSQLRFNTSVAASQVEIGGSFVCSLLQSLRLDSTSSAVCGKLEVGSSAAKVEIVRRNCVS